MLHSNFKLAQLKNLSKQIASVREKCQNSQTEHILYCNFTQKSKLKSPPIYDHDNYLHKFEVRCHYDKMDILFDAKFYSCRVRNFVNFLEGNKD